MLKDCRLQEIMNIPGLTGKEDIEYLCKIAEGVRSWTEIGVWCGRSFYAIGICLPQGALIQGIDKNLGTFQKANQSFLSTYIQLTQMRPDLRIVMHKMESRYCEDAACNTDVVFIDGNHTYEHVKIDIEIWSKKAKIILGHDYGRKEWGGVQKAVDEVKNSPRFHNFGVHNSIWRLDVKG